MISRPSVLIRSRRPFVFAALLSILLPSIAEARIPEYEFELQARAALTQTPVGAYNLPVGAWLSNETVSVNLDRQVAFAMSTDVAAEDGVWFGGGGAGQIVFRGPSGALVGQTSLNDRGLVVFDIEYGNDDGIYSYDAATGTPMKITSGPGNSDGWFAPQVTSDGGIGYQAIRAGTRSVAWWDGAQAVSIVSELPDFDYVFTPATADGPLFAVKVTPAGGNENEIRLYDVDGNFTTIAVGNGNPYSDFDNGLDVNAGGQVAFIGRLPGGTREVVVSDGTTSTVFASEGTADLAKIDFFRPTLNDRALVAFRGYDTNDDHAIFVSDGDELRVLVREGDIVPTDNGEGQLGQSDENAPVFSAEPVVNNRGDIAFAAGLTPVNDTQTEWGVGVYVALSDMEAPATEDMGPNPDDMGTVAPDAGTPSTDAGTSPDLGAPGPADVGSEPPSAPDAGSLGDDIGTTAGTDGGCCATTRSHPAPPWLLILLFGALLLRRNRRGSSPG